MARSAPDNTGAIGASTRVGSDLTCSANTGTPVYTAPPSVSNWLGKCTSPPNANLTVRPLPRGPLGPIGIVDVGWPAPFRAAPAWPPLQASANGSVRAGRARPARRSSRRESSTSDLLPSDPAMRSVDGSWPGGYFRGQKVTAHGQLLPAERQRATHYG